MDRKDLTREMRWCIAEQMAADQLEDINARLSDVQVRDTFYTRYGKRAIDIILSFVLLVVTAPVNLFLGVVTFFDVGSPVFFRQQRLGKDGKLFELIKFRNMHNTRDEKGELLPPSERVTKWGKFVRNASLDELLNFWSILKGDMSIIGPRPLLPEHLCRFHKRHRQRLAVRPGLECPPRELNGKVWTWQEQFENDVWYVENVSFKTDCIMVWNLVRFALDRKSASARAVVTRGIFMGYDLNGTAIVLEDVPQKYIDMFDNETDSYLVSSAS